MKKLLGVFALLGVLLLVLRRVFKFQLKSLIAELNTYLYDDVA